MICPEPVDTLVHLPPDTPVTVCFESVDHDTRQIDGTALIDGYRLLLVDANDVTLLTLDIGKPATVGTVFPFALSPSAMPDVPFRIRVQPYGHAPYDSTSRATPQSLPSNPVCSDGVVPLVTAHTAQGRHYTVTLSGTSSACP